MQLFFKPVMPVTEIKVTLTQISTDFCSLKFYDDWPAMLKKKTEKSSLSSLDKSTLKSVNK